MKKRMMFGLLGLVAVPDRNCTETQQTSGSWLQTAVRARSLLKEG